MAPKGKKGKPKAKATKQSAQSSVVEEAPVDPTLINLGPKSNDNKLWSWLLGSKTRKYKLNFEDGDEYEGALLDGRFHGQGKYRMKDGETYEGEWIQGKHHGRGVKVWPDGTRYEGEYQNDVREGLGTGTYPSGTKYVGEWKGGHATGEGEMHWADHDESAKLFKVTLKGDEVHESAVPKYYKGQFVDGVMHGQGRLEFRNGDYYEGGFANGLFDGQGLYEIKGKERFEGAWRGGKLNGRGMYTCDREEYDGEFANGRRTGKGVVRFFRRAAPGAPREPYGEWEGEFVDGVRSGRGKHCAPPTPGEGEERGEELHGEWWQHTAARHPLPRQAVLTVLAEAAAAPARRERVRRLELARAQRELSAGEYERFRRSGEASSGAAGSAEAAAAAAGDRGSGRAGGNRMSSGAFEFSA